MNSYISNDFQSLTVLQFNQNNLIAYVLNDEIPSPRTSLERLMCVQFTLCVYGESFMIGKVLETVNSDLFGWMLSGSIGIKSEELVTTNLHLTHDLFSRDIVGCIVG